jgi:hypothetical protein
MVERRRRARLADETLDGIGMEHAAPRKELYDEVTPKLGIARVIELAHTTGAQQRYDLIPADWRAGGYDFRYGHVM